MDHTGFPVTYFLDLHHVACHPRRLKFNWRRIISQVRSPAHSFLVNGAFRDSARRRPRRLRKAVARRGHFPLTANFDRELGERGGAISRVVPMKRGGGGNRPRPTQRPGQFFRELGSVVTVEPKWSLEGVFPSRAVSSVAARQETR